METSLPRDHRPLDDPKVSEELNAERQWRLVRNRNRFDCSLLGQ